VKNVDTSGFPPELPELAPDVRAALGILAMEYHHLDMNARKEDFQRQVEFMESWCGVICVTESQVEEGAK
jgi:hypothetical protein